MKLVLFLLMFICLPCLAQQQVVPPDFNREQAHLFKKLTEAVSTPCCRNGIPVAYHDSGMAQYVRNAIIQSLREGKSEEIIMADLANMTMGPDKDHLIFTVPENNSLGWIVWAAPPAFVFLGIGLVVLCFRGKDSRGNQPSRNNLLETYRNHIRTQVDALD